MKKADLKQLIKPIVKECIHEVLLEEGLLSNVVSEVARGLQPEMIAESRDRRVPTPTDDTELIREKAERSREKMRAKRRDLMKSIGADAYNGVDLFEGTEPMTQYESSESKAGTVDLGSPADSGVDISSLVGGVSRMWNAMK